MSTHTQADFDGIGCHVMNPCMQRFHARVTQRTDVMNWLLSGWIKDDLLLDNPNRADDYIILTLTAGGGNLYLWSS